MIILRWFLFFFFPVVVDFCLSFLVCANGFYVLSNQMIDTHTLVCKFKGWYRDEEYFVFFSWVLIRQKFCNHWMRSRNSIGIDLSLLDFCSTTNNAFMNQFTTRSSCSCSRNYKSPCRKTREDGISSKSPSARRGMAYQYRLAATRGRQIKS